MESVIKVFEEKITEMQGKINRYEHAINQHMKTIESFKKYRAEAEVLLEDMRKAIKKLK